MRILVVEDDADVAGLLSEALGRFGHAVNQVNSGAGAIEAVADTDFVLLDLGLPDLDGQEVCRRLRAFSMVPIVVVSGRSDEVDRVLLLQMGADDYVVKPYSTRELLARIEAVGRRTGGVLRSGVPEPGVSASGVPEPGVPVARDPEATALEVGVPDPERAVALARPPVALMSLPPVGGAVPVSPTWPEPALVPEPEPVPRRDEVRALGPLRVDLRTRQVQVADREVPLTRREFDLLVALLADPGAVRQREDLIDEVWDANWYGSTRTLDVHVGSLRTKLGHRDWIRSVRGVGFRLCLPRPVLAADPEATASPGESAGHRA